MAKSKIPKILLVEDNPTDEKLTIRAFSKCGIAVEIAVVRDGAEALDYLHGTGPYQGQRLCERLAIVLLDLNLPRLGGLEVLYRLRQNPRTAALPIVILTASKEEEDILRGYTLGANAYVRKPVDFAELGMAAKTLSQFWLSLNQPPPTRGGEA